MPQEDEEMPLAAGFVPVSTGNQQVCSKAGAAESAGAFVAARQASRSLVI